MDLRELKPEKEEENATNAPSFDPNENLVAQGPNGEICIWRKDAHTYEFWVWGPACSVPGYQSPSGSGNDTEDKNHAKECLLLYLVKEAPGRSVSAICFMCQPYGTVFISACSDKDGAFLEVLDGDNTSTDRLPDLFNNSLSNLKVSSDLIVVSSVYGHLYFLQYKRQNSKKDLTGKISFPETDSLLLIRFHCTKPIITEENLQCISSRALLIKTATFDSAAMFDIVGSWLVYAPTRLEVDYFKRLQISSDNSANGRNEKKNAAKSIFTPVKLLIGNPLLVGMMSNVTSNAFDKLFKLSLFGSKKFRSYMSSSNKILDKDVSLHSISSSIGKALYSTASKLKKQALLSEFNEYIKILDLSNGKIMATFKPPGGVSHLSLSAYDLHLIHSSSRGDNFYMWDLCKLPKEVSLVEKFTRGKTSAKIQEIAWFVNDKNTEALPGTNSGFGCITKESGSIHWYNINYLFCGNETNNYPNVMTNTLAQKIPASGHFLDSWILPSNKAQRFFKLPRNSNLIQSGSHGETTPASKSRPNTLTQLAFLDSEGCLRLLSPLNGKHTFKYILPLDSNSTANKEMMQSIERFKDNRRKECIEGKVPQFPISNSIESQEFEIPLSQTEIETAAPYLSLIRNRNVEIFRYDFGGDSDAAAFFRAFATFGNEIPTVQQCFAKDSDTNTSMHLSGHLEGGIELLIEEEDQQA